MPNRWSWFALGVGAYLAFTVSSFPAATAYRWFAPDELRLSAITGSVWSGGATLGSIPGLPMRDLRWKLSSWPLLLGRASGEFEARLADGFVRGQFRASTSSLTLSSLQVSTSLPTLRGLLPLNDTEGLVSLTLESLEVRDAWPVELVGVLRINELRVMPLMATQTQERIAMGNYEVQFTDTGGQGLAGQLHDTGGPLEATGSVALSLDRSYMLEGLVRARDGASAELIQGLDFMTGEPNADGRRPFSLTGSL
jgi:hypothetical protein